MYISCGDKSSLINPLLFIPSPRDIAQVQEAISKLKISKLFVKYHNQPDAYDIARDFFLKQSSFTHLLICPDDLVVTQKDIDAIQKHPEDLIVSGFCVNTINDNWEEQNDSCISFALPPNPPHTGIYEDYHFLSVPFLEDMKDIGSTFLQVYFQGFALSSIPRKIIEKIPFRTDDGCCVDSCFSLDLTLNDIKQYVDLSIRTTHLKTKKEDLLVGKRDELVIFERC